MPRFPITRKQAIVLAAVLVLVLFLFGRQLGQGSTPSSPAVQPLGADAASPASALPKPKSASTELVVQVVGAVRQPGLYRLPAGSRVADAVRRAGGPSRRADTQLINLAAPLSDGIQVIVPRKGAGSSVGAPAGAAAGGGQPAGPVHLNSASLEDLEALPGVGPVTAQKILDYRQQHGPFTSVDELDAVPGIGPAHMAQLRDRVAP
jgi:competence protein ComEA